MARGDNRSMKTIRVLLCCLPDLFCATAAAQPVTRIVVPFSAGGGQDNVARILGPDLGAPRRRSVIAEKRTGAGGTLGNARVGKAAPEGRAVLRIANQPTIT